MVVFVQKRMNFGQKRLYSGRNGCIWVNVVVFWQGSCIRAKWLYRPKMIGFGKSGCIRANVVVIGQKWWYSGKLVVFGEKWLYLDKVVLFGKIIVFG